MSILGLREWRVEGESRREGESEERGEDRGSEEMVGEIGFDAEEVE